jgi:hypothetical protein
MTNVTILNPGPDNYTISSGHWYVSGTGWSLDSPSDSICARYTAGSGTGTFKLVLTNTSSGCKDSCTVSFDCTQIRLFCSLTQGAYGNANGRFCGGPRRLELITNLLSAPFGNLVIGFTAATRSITYDNTDAQCIINRMPAGGPSAILPLANYTYPGTSCTESPSSPSLPLQNGRYRNNMLGQTLALGLNLRLSSLHTLNLAGLVIGGPYITTLASTGCDPETSSPVPGTEETFSISPSVISALTTTYGAGNETVGNLFDLANRALAGLSTGGASLGAIHDAVGAFNEGFDECRYLKEFSETAPGKVIAISGQSELPTAYDLSVNYPNPFNPTTTIEYALPDPSRVTLKVYNVLGQEVATLVNDVMDAGYQSVNWNASNNNGISLSSGVYIYRLQATSIASGKEFMKVRKMLLLK